MQYVGIQTQIDRNNSNSVVLLLLFPCIILAAVWLFCCVFGYRSSYDEYHNTVSYMDWDTVTAMWIKAVPWVVGIVGIWFLIAYICNSQMIEHATGSCPLERRENPHIYNMVENLCMSCGMDMPKINIVDDPQLNAFASGISKKTYAVTLTTGIIRLLDDAELEGVIAHELTHIRNRDTRLLIVSIVFVGIVATVLNVLANTVLRMFLYGGGRRSRDDKEGGAGLIIIFGIVAVVCSAIAYFFVSLTRFAILRKREFMADAGGAELTRNPRALASALRKISGNPGLGQVGREDIAQLYIIHPKKLAQGFLNKIGIMFSTHPSTEERIRILEQF